MADEARRRLVLHGGLDRAALDDTWEWDGRTWFARPTPSRPLPAGQHAATFDARTGRIVRFGGHDTTRIYDDNWTYGPTWPAAVEPFGQGCAGSAGVPLLRPSGSALP